MFFLARRLLITILLLAISTTTMAAQLKGTVVKVSNLDVTVKIDGELMPSVGDQMEISFMLPDGELLPVGTWQITGVTGNRVNASVLENTGNPVVGHKAVIFSDNPVSIQRNIEQTPRKTGYENYNTYGVKDEVQLLIDKMRSSNSGDKRNAARTAYRNFLHNSSVITVAGEELEKGYNINLSDRYHVDAMAWFCNVLGASNDQRYVQLLKRISKESNSEKIRKFAKKNYKKLR